MQNVGTPYHSGLALGSLGNATLTKSGDLPQGLTFNPSSGEISGTVLDTRDAGKAFLFSVQVASTPQGQTAPVVGQVLTFSLNVSAVNPSTDTDDADVTVSFPRDSSDFPLRLPGSAGVGQPYSATVKVTGPDGKYLILMPCAQEKPEKESEPRISPGCMARRWFNLSPSFTLNNQAGGKTVLTTLSGEIEDELDLEALPWSPGETDLAFDICKENAESVKDGYPWCCATDPYLPDSFLGDVLFRVARSNFAEAGG